MVVAAYPLAKVGLLLLKQLSKPLANIIKDEAKRHPKVRQYIIVPTGRAFIKAENKFVPSARPKLAEKLEIPEEDAVETGANALGEIILFGLLCLILMLEYNRQSDKKATVEQIKADEVANIQDLLLDVIDDVDKLKKTVRDIEKDLTAATDIFAMEEMAHAQVHDHNFLDIFINRKKKTEDIPNIDIDPSSE